MTSQKLASVFFILVTILAFQANANKLVIKQHPSYQVYDYDSGILKFSDFKNILLASHGFSINHDVEWKGLKSTNPLVTPKKTYLFLIDSDQAIEGKSIELDLDESLNFESFNKKFSSLNHNVFKSFDFLPSINELKTVENELPQSIDSYFFTFKVSKSDSAKLNDLIKSIEKSNDDSVVYVLSTDSKLREKRDVEKRLIGNSIVNRAILYSDNYPVTFHLIFWTSLILVLAIIAVTCGMGSMDPGLDTVIYRMTSQRIKKDN